MNILELCLSPSLGGLELYMLRTTKVLSKNDAVLAIILKTGRLKTFFEKENRSFLTEKTGFHLFPVLAARRLAAIIDKHDIDVIHMHWGKDLALAALSKWFSKKRPSLIYTRQMKMTRSKDDFYHNFLYRKVDRMLVITDKLERGVKKFLARDNAGKVKRLYYGVDVPRRLLKQDERERLRRSLGIGRVNFVVGLFGRIEKIKGQYLLVEALVRVKTRHDVITGLIVGHAMEESYLNHLKSIVDQKGLTQHIVFKGFVDHPQDWMQICDCVLLATHEETFGLVLIEAMSVGVAVIGSESGGVPEIIDDGKTGLLFRPEDSEHLYQCILRLKENEIFRSALASAGEEKARRFFGKKQHYKTLREYMSDECSVSCQV